MGDDARASAEGAGSSRRADRWFSSFWKADLSLLISRESRRSRDDVKLLYSEGRAQMSVIERSSSSKLANVNDSG